jgi:hypothetical protein
VLLFYSMVTAGSVEEATEKVVVYRDPGFSTRTLGIAEVADQLSSDDLYALLEHNKVLRTASL